LKPQAQIIWEPPTYKVFDNEEMATRAINQLLNNTRQSQLVLDLEVGEEKDDSFGHPNTLLAAGISYAPGKAIVIGERAFTSREVRTAFSTLCKKKNLICHNAKYDLGVLHRMNIGTFNVSKDTMLMAYTMNEVPGTKGLKYLGQERLGTPDWDSEIKPYLKGKDGGWHNIPKDLLYKYNAYDVAVTWDLMELFESEMDSNDHKLHKFLCWASDQLMLIESEGIYIDQQELKDIDITLSSKLTEIKHNLTQMVQPHLTYFDERITRLIEANKGFNPNSPDQVKAILQLLTGARLTGTDIEILEMLTRNTKPGVKEFVQQMIQWRKIGKLYGTYIKGLWERLDDDGRVRTSYLLHGTETGRLSSRNPNVQNVARESEYANVRRVYAAEPGNTLIYADYGNIEGRIVSVLADDENMQEVLRDTSRDIHGEVASMIYGENYTKANRHAAKSVVHGKNYARTAEGIAEGLGISAREAQKISRAYDRLYPNVQEWHKLVKHQVLKTEEPLLTPWGRKRRFGLITRDNAEDVYKEALAFQPQGIASDICLTAGIRLKELGFSVRILIHDGLVIEIPQEEVTEAKPIIKQVMEDAGKEFTEKVPFPVDVETGLNWGVVN